MTTYLKIGFICGNCPAHWESSYMPHDNQPEARAHGWEAAAKAGWTTDGHWYSEDHLCPACSKVTAHKTTTENEGRTT